MLLALALAGCAPLTAYRQTLVVAVPEPPAAIGAPAHPGQVILGGGLTAYPHPLPDLAPEEGDPGLLFPGHGFHGYARLGVLPGLEVGGEALYASGSAGSPSAVGVLAVPGDDAVYAVGAHINAGPRGEHWGAGFSVDAMWTSMPYARYEWIGPGPALGTYGPGDAEQFYALYERGRVHPIRVRAAATVQANYGAFEGVAGVAICPVFTNVGFSDEEQHAYQSGGLAVLPTVKAGARVGDVHLYGQAWYGAGFPGGVSGQLGAEVRLGGARAVKATQPARPAPEDPRGERHHDAPI